MSTERPSQESGKFEFKYFPDPEQRSALTWRTLELINILDREEINHLLFLDKGARPLSTIVQDFWREVHPGVPLPKIAFMQIGRETGGYFNYEGELVGDPDRDKDIKKDYEDEIERVRKEYSDIKTLELSQERAEEAFEADRPNLIANYSEEKWKAKLDQLYRARPKIMVVDDVEISGDSLRAAKDILQAAFPKIADRDIFTFPFAYHEGETEYDDNGKRIEIQESRLFTPDWDEGGGIRTPWMHKPGVTGVTDKKDMLTAHSAHKAGFPQEAVNELRDEMHQIAIEQSSNWRSMYAEIKSIVAQREKENEAIR